MSAIEGIGLAGAGRLPSRTRASGADRFSVDTVAGPALQPRAAEAAPASAPAGMLSLQEIGTESPRDRAARRHGRALLAALARLQRHLLGAPDDGTTLLELADLAATVPAATDPAIAATLKAVVLRARVELARRGH